jgi:hypothetical protein
MRLSEVFGDWDTLIRTTDLFVRLWVLLCWFREVLLLQEVVLLIGYFNQIVGSVLLGVRFRFSVAFCLEKSYALGSEHSLIFLDLHKNI